MFFPTILFSRIGSPRICGLLFLSGLLVIASAGDMMITLEDGVEVTLHNDNTWSYTTRSPFSLSSDMNLQLDDGNSIVLKTDKTWAYTTESRKTSKNKSLANAFSSGYALHEDISIATQKAKEIAIGRLHTKLASAFGREIDTGRLSACIEAMNEQTHINNTQNEETKQWKVSVSFTMYEDDIQTVRECAKKQKSGK